MVSIKGDLPEATENLKGLMSAQDKTKLNNIDGNIIKLAEEGETLTDDGIYLIVPSVVKITVTGNSITLGNYSIQIISDDVYWIKFENNSYNGTVHWGDGTSTEVNGQEGRVSHTYEDGLNNHEIVIENVIALGQYCFANVSNITSVFIPKKVTEIEDNCFDSCTGLTSVNIPNTITRLNDGTFTGCTGLTSINIPSSVTEIIGAFKGCTGLTSIIIPPSVTEITWSAFENCTSLTSVTIPSSVTDIYGYVFNGCDSLIDYQLYWTSEIPTYDSDNMPDNENAIFTIPYGKTADYEEAGYPSNKLVERS